MERLTVKQVAERTGLTPRQIQYQIKEGFLIANFNMDLKRSEISEADFETWQKNRRGRGRPRKS